MAEPSCFIGTKWKRSARLCPRLLFTAIFVLRTRGSVQAQTDIAAYWSVVRQRWPGLELDAVKRFANVGRMFWALDPITGEVEPLTGNWVGNVMRKMRFYHAELAAAIQIAGWMP